MSNLIPTRGTIAASDPRHDGGGQQEAPAVREAVAQGALAAFPEFRSCLRVVAADGAAAVVRQVQFRIAVPRKAP